MMAIVEVQIGTNRFCELVKGEIDSFALDKPTYDAPAEIAGKPLEAIECTACSLNQNLSGPNLVVLDTTFSFAYHESLNDVRAAGSRNAAVPARKDYEFRLRLWADFDDTPAHRPLILYKILPFGLDLPSAKTGTFPIQLPPDLSVIAIGIVADDHVVAIRLGTAAADPVNETPPIDRTGGHEWIQLVPGNLIADTIRRTLDQTLAAAVVPPPKPDPNKPWLPQPKVRELRKDYPATAAWAPFLPGVNGYGEIVAVDACPIFNVDITIDLGLTVTFAFPDPGTLRTRAVLTWNADSTLCDVLSTIAFTGLVGTAFHVGIENEVSDTILGKHVEPGDGFAEVAHTDSEIVFERLAGSPQPPSSQFKTTYGGVTFGGLEVGGTVVPKTRPQLVIDDVMVAAPELVIDCNIRSVSTTLSPAKVLLRTDQPPTLPWVWLENAVFDPPGAWVIDMETEFHSPASSTPQHVILTFRDPPTGRLPVGTATSVYLFTNWGVRWIDLGTIPNVSAEPFVGARRLMNEYCDSIVNPWIGGLADITYADPLVDPDYGHQSEIQRVRVWTIGVRDLPDTARLELIVIGVRGQQRALGVIEGRRNVALEIAAEPHERIAVRTARAFDAPPPTLSYRWLYLGSDAAVAYRRSTDRAHDDSLSVAGASLSEFVADRLVEAESRGRLRWATAVPLGRRMLAVMHGGRVVVGTVGVNRRIR
jgi:hypothetical protein